MGNQLRASLYVLSRSPWAILAAIVPALCGVAGVVLGVTSQAATSAGVASVLSLGIAQMADLSLAEALLHDSTLMLVMVVVLGLASDDLVGGVRMACAAERGRGGYVDSRFARALGVSVALGAYTAAALLLPGVATAWAAGDPAPVTLSADDALRALGAFLLLAAYAEIAQLVCWAVDGGVAQGLMGCFLLGMLEFLAFQCLQGLALPDRPLAGLFDTLCRLLPLSCAQAFTDASAAPSLAALAVPVLWLALAHALSRRLWARRSV